MKEEEEEDEEEEEKRERHVGGYRDEGPTKPRPFGSSRGGWFQWEAISIPFP